jgi:hypothetical protein
LGEAKGNANRRQYKIKIDFFIFIVKMQPTLGEAKGSANRRQYKIKMVLF